MSTQTTSRGTMAINGAELYYELRGAGPSLLFIAGATGDAGHFEHVAEALADEYTVVTYDRRGNSRSPRPAGWTATSMDEQADDAAGLLRALDCAPATVFGTSGGAVILLDLLGRHPEVIRAALIHEPPLLSVLPGGADLGAQFERMTKAALAEAGPRGAMERFIRLNAGDHVFERLDTTLRARMLGNAEVFFGAELAAFVSYMPDPAALRGTSVPVVALAGADNRATARVEGGYLYEAAQWVADRAGAPFHELPGAHAPYLDRPQALVEALRPVLSAVR